MVASQIHGGRQPQSKHGHFPKAERYGAYMRMYVDAFAEMRDDLADYAGTGRRPGGLRLASLRGPRSTDNFWTTALVSLRYLLGLTLTHSIVTRIPPVSSTSAPSPKSRVRGHFSLPTLLPRFPLFLPFVFLDLLFILFPSPTVTNLRLCPDLMTTFPCDALMRSYDTL